MRKNETIKLNIPDLNYIKVWLTKNNMLERLYDDLGLTYQVRGENKKITIDDATLLFKECSDFNEFKIKYNSEYQYLNRNNLLNNFCEINNIKYVVRNKKHNYNIEEICEIYKQQCSSFSDFQKNHGAAYHYLFKNKLIDYFCETNNIVRKNQNVPKNWSIEEISELYKQCIGKEVNGIRKCKLEFRTLQYFKKIYSLEYRYLKRHNLVDDFCKRNNIKSIKIK